MKTLNLLIIEDDEDMAELLGELARAAGFDTRVSLTAQDGFKECQCFMPEVLLTDLRLPDGSGLTLLDQVKTLNEDVLVVMITGYASMEDAIEGFKLGLYDLITKPFETRQVANLLERVQEQLSQRFKLQQMETRLTQLEAESVPVESQSKTMQAVLAEVVQAAPLDVPVLINGETGVGKGVLARQIHQISHRAQGPFFSLNCAAVPENLIESELFGYEKGAFTGATQRKAGLLELAHGGTLLLDEINSTQPDVQAKLLHFLQDQTLVRVGGQSAIQVDVRLLFASNQSLKALVEKGQFRSDLYYRIHVFPVELPALRHREADIEALARAFVHQYAQKFGKSVRELSPRVVEALKRYHWPGNIRELENIVQRAVVLAKGSEIEMHHLPKELLSIQVPQLLTESGEQALPEDATLADMERFWIEHVLGVCEGNKRLAADKLGIDASTLYRKLQTYQS
ncbi:sigma-54 dependent transcriptional regulator [Thiomicrospira sp. WB1]|uniref:sigma-54-dependent transcriptional regulator n=1 Tax=Thiomicrospira sp. WB1 TaxID=1685380 RepID=UPI00074A1641|nr:sigma-54 dependent transcriptional regulator [Thiomicrospira sp. WB1]KUJ71457.1 Fis family transcriptional regulator [Thiomicrospira sp. WB1]